MTRSGPASDFDGDLRMTEPLGPSHTVPAGGIPAWASPDGATPIVANLDPGLPVAVTEGRGDWVRVVASNGWQGWVDGRRLVPLAGPTQSGPPPGPAWAGAAGPVTASSIPPGSTAWLSAAPGPSETAQGPSARPRRRGPGCLGCLLIVLVVVVGVPVGVFAAFRFGIITPQMLLNVIGQGPGYVQVDNLRDDAISVSVADTSTASDAAASSDATLNSFDIRTLTAPKAGRYLVTATDPGGTTIATCTLTVHSGDNFMFVVLPDVTIVHRNDDNVSEGSELFVTTSSLCR